MVHDLQLDQSHVNPNRDCGSDTRHKMEDKMDLKLRILLLMVLMNMIVKKTEAQNSVSNSNHLHVIDKRM